MKNRTRASGVVLALAAAAALVAGLAPRTAEAIYRYFSRQALAIELDQDADKWLDQDVTVTDELVFVWKPGPNDTADGTQYVKFDTLYFRCAVTPDKKAHLDALWETTQKNAKDILEKIEDLNDKARTGAVAAAQAETQRKELYKELHERNKDKPFVTIFGKVRRADFWGPVQGKEEGQVRSEAVTIVADRIEKPRDRWYESLDD